MKIGCLLGVKKSMIYQTLNYFREYGATMVLLTIKSWIVLIFKSSRLLFLIKNHVLG